MSYNFTLPILSNSTIEDLKDKHFKTYKEYPITTIIPDSSFIDNFNYSQENEYLYRVINLRSGFVVGL